MVDFNPKGIAWFSTVVPWIVSLYKFRAFPLPNVPFNDKEGIKFEGGESDPGKSADSNKRPYYLS